MQTGKNRFCLPSPVQQMYRILYLMLKVVWGLRPNYITFFFFFCWALTIIRSTLISLEVITFRSQYCSGQRTLQCHMILYLMMCIGLNTFLSVPCNQSKTHTEMLEQEAADRTQRGSARDCPVPSKNTGRRHLLLLLPRRRGPSRTQSSLLGVPLVLDVASWLVFY